MGVELGYPRLGELMESQWFKIRQTGCIIYHQIRLTWIVNGTSDIWGCLFRETHRKVGLLYPLPSHQCWDCATGMYATVETWQSQVWSIDPLSVIMSNKNSPRYTGVWWSDSIPRIRNTGSKSKAHIEISPSLPLYRVQQQETMSENLHPSLSSYHQLCAPHRWLRLLHFFVS